MIVLILLGAAATLVMPSFTSGLAGVQLEGAARDFVTAVKRARLEAVSRQEPRRIVIPPDDRGGAPNRYLLTDEYERPLQEFILPDGIAFAAAGNRDTVVISFYADGTSSGADLWLRNSYGKRLRVVVSPVTGYGKIVRAAE
ncbi:MAG: hypothetical protein Kow00109_11120 [Acidobacteriota bacterium]